MFSDGDSHGCAFLILFLTKNPDHVKSQFFCDKCSQLGENYFRNDNKKKKYL